MFFKNQNLVHEIHSLYSISLILLSITLKVCNFKTIAIHLSEHIWIVVLLGFLEKNRDTIWEEQIDLLKRSTVVETLFSDDFSSEVSQKSGKLKITPVIKICWSALFI